MDVRKEEFPIVIQAYDTDAKNDNFLAEQVVHSQAEVDLFTSRFTGKLIKARKLTTSEFRPTKEEHVDKTKARSGSGILWVIVLLVIAGLVAWGWYTGWIATQFNR
ncbi:MAG: hypothetical protein ACXWV5_03365 [Flavitalea sp.]